MDFSPIFGSALGTPTQQGMENSPSKSRQSISLRSLHSAMITKAIPDGSDFTPEDLEVDGKPVTNVTMVGKVIESVSSPSFIKLRLVDDFGEFPVQIWRRNNMEMPDFSVDEDKSKYVRVYGTIKNEKGKPLLVAFSAREVTNFNEIIHHSLEVMNQHLHFTKGPAKALQSQENFMGSQRSSMFGTPTPALKTRSEIDRNLSPMSIVGTPNVGSDPGSGGGGGGGLLESIKTVFKGDQSEVGLHIDEIVEKISGSHAKDDVKKILDFLVNEGNIYTTTTEEHYQWCG